MSKSPGHVGNAHFIYCLARAGEGQLVQKSLHSIFTHISGLPAGYRKEVWQTVALPLFKGINAFAEEDYSSACRFMEASILRCFELGGSDAQNELYTQTYLLSLLKSGQQRKAHHFFNQWLPHYKNTALSEYWFASS